MNNALESLRRLNVSRLVTIGGDDTAFSASEVSRLAGGDVKVAHIPKTIDNDLPLPDNMPTSDTKPRGSWERIWSATS